MRGAFCSCLPTGPEHLLRPEVDLCWYRKLVFDETVARQKERAAKEEKRRRHAREDFTALLKDSREIKPDTTWEDAQPLLEKHPEYKAVSGCSTPCHASVSVQD